MSVSEPLTKCREVSKYIETEVLSISRDKPGGNLHTVQAMYGIKVA